MRRNSLIWNSDESTESSSFDSEVPTTAALVNLAMCLSFLQQTIDIKVKKMFENTIFYRITSKEKKIASGIILILASCFCFISKRKKELAKNRNTKIVFLLLPLLSGFYLFINFVIALITNININLNKTVCKIKKSYRIIGCVKIIMHIKNYLQNCLQNPKTN